MLLLEDFTEAGGVGRGGGEGWGWWGGGVPDPPL